MKTVKQIIEEQNKYAAKCGGTAYLLEADDAYNDYNRAIIAAFKEQVGTCLLVRLEHYDDRAEIISGEKSVFEEYTGQMVFNFGCNYCLPKTDEEFANMIRKWNADEFEFVEDRLKLLSRIDKRVQQLGGLEFIWS